MSFFAVLFALLLEQVKPLPRGNVVHDALTGWMRWHGAQLRRRQGQPRLGRLVHHRARAGARLLRRVYVGARRSCNTLLGLAFDVAVLYLTLGFRQFSHYFTDIRNALDRGDEIEARRLLAEWRHLDASELPRIGVPAPRDRAFAAGRASPRLRRLLLVRAALDLRPRPGRRGALPAWPSSSSRYWAYRSGNAGDRRQRAPDGAVAAPVPPARPRAGAAHRVGLRGRRQLRGGGQLLAPRRRRSGSTTTKA